MTDNNPYMGATVGRVANRINKGRFTIDGEKYNVTSQSPDYSLHGGLEGFNKVRHVTISVHNYIFTCIHDYRKYSLSKSMAIK